MREWGAEAVTSLVRSALTFDHKPPLAENTVSLFVSFLQRNIQSLIDNYCAFCLIVEAPYLSVLSLENQAHLENMMF